MEKWALILGGSSGIGLATAHKLSHHNFNLIVIHRDRRSEMERVTKEFDEIRKRNVTILNYNFDATSEDKAREFSTEILRHIGNAKIDLLLHSISRGNLKPLIGTETRLSSQDLILTSDAMAFSLLMWVNLLKDLNLFNDNSVIVTLTSGGSQKFWRSYAAVGVAKSALETLTKYLAVELAPEKIKVNCIMAGITDTPSLRMIPGYEDLKSYANERNPGKRMTKPEDIANVVYLLSLPEANWITGSIIHVDGGEHLIG